MASGAPFLFSLPEEELLVELGCGGGVVRRQHGREHEPAQHAPGAVPAGRRMRAMGVVRVVAAVLKVGEREARTE